MKKLISLLRVYCEKDGWYLNVDVVDSQTLMDAQKHPERYPNLAVRVSGWSARFITLSKEWQDMVIQRTQRMLR
ncbi:MAG: glycine radical domain-containing protein [Anaerolineae bacterium]|nr:glycine radical domain-containing protein [Anaerolineae bacterium]